MIPVEPTLASGEKRAVFGKDQPEYIPLPAAIDRAGNVTTEWEFSAEDLEKVLSGGRVRISVLTFGQPLQPLRVQVVP